MASRDRNSFFATRQIVLGAAALAVLGLIAWGVFGLAGLRERMQAASLRAEITDDTGLTSAFAYRDDPFATGADPVTAFPGGGFGQDAQAVPSSGTTAADPVVRVPLAVDTIAYQRVRQALLAGAMPPAEAIRAEAFVNLFAYAYPQPPGRDAPFAVFASILPAPWDPARWLLHVGLQGLDPPGSGPDATAPIASDLAVEIAFEPGRIAQWRWIGGTWPGPAGTVTTESGGPPPGSILPGLQVTHLFELTPVTPPGAGAALAEVRLSYGLGPGNTQRKMVRTITDEDRINGLGTAPDPVRLSAAAAGLARIVANPGDPSPFDLRMIQGLLAGVRGADPQGLRASLLETVAAASAVLQPQAPLGRAPVGRDPSASVPARMPRQID